MKTLNPHENIINPYENIVNPYEHETRDVNYFYFSYNYQARSIWDKSVSGYREYLNIYCSY